MGLTNFMQIWFRKIWMTFIINAVIPSSSLSNEKVILATHLFQCMHFLWLEKEYKWALIFSSVLPILCRLLLAGYEPAFILSSVFQDPWRRWQNIHFYWPDLFIINCCHFAMATEHQLLRYTVRWIMRTGSSRGLLSTLICWGQEVNLWATPRWIYWWYISVHRQLKAAGLARPCFQLIQTSWGVFWVIFLSRRLSIKILM